MDALGDFSVAQTSLSGLLVVIIGLVIRSIIKGDLVPRSTLDRIVSEKDARILAQATALEAAPTLAIDQQAAISSLTDSVKDFAEASQLQVRLADALHKNLTPGGE